MGGLESRESEMLERVIERVQLSRRGGQKLEAAERRVAPRISERIDERALEEPRLPREKETVLADVVGGEKFGDHEVGRVCKAVVLQGLELPELSGARAPEGHALAGRGGGRHPPSRSWPS